MKELLCNDWKELTSNIRMAKEILNNPKKVWFRGQSNSKFKLIPSLLRISDGLKKEQDCFYKFKQLSSRLHFESKDDWEMVFSMQHYWIPTRLLDWSEVVGVPLFFAAKYNQTYEENEAIALFVLDPLQMNLKRQMDHIPQLPGTNEVEYQRFYLHKIPEIPSTPIAIIPNYNHDRLFAQKGVFTIHPDTSRSIEDLCPDCLVKITIPKKVIPEILEFLDFAGVNEMSIFPDMQGAAEYLKSTLMRK